MCYYTGFSVEKKEYLSEAEKKTPAEERPHGYTRRLIPVPCCCSAELGQGGPVMSINTCP